MLQLLFYDRLSKSRVAQYLKNAAVELVMRLSAQLGPLGNDRIDLYTYIHTCFIHLHTHTHTYIYIHTYTCTYV